MNNLDTLIENGLVVTENEIDHLNIGIKDGKIAYLGDENLNAEFLTCGSIRRFKLFCVIIRQYCSMSCRNPR